MTSPGIMLRTIARLRLRQIVLRPYARIAPAIARRSTRLMAVEGNPQARIAAWSAKVIAIDERTAVEDARELLEKKQLTLAGRVVAAEAIGRAEFPSRLAAYEYHYRRWLIGLALLARHGEVGVASVMDAWRPADETFAASNVLFEPYVLARRVVSEALALGAIGDDVGGDGRPTAMASLAREAAALERLTESHLGANHELTHDAVVATIRLLLCGTSGEKALHRYVRTLKTQIDREGIHEERSPAYHLIALQDLRRVRAAAEVAGAAVPELDRIDAEMTSAMSLLLHPDGSFPMFHDTPAIVRPAASDLGVDPSRERFRDLPASGFFSWRAPVAGSDFHLVGDFGSPRPAHQPGHQHAAPLSIEVWWGRLFITSAGETSYAADERRAFERGAAAHATLRIDGAEPAEIWSAFRMGRGYRVFGRSVSESGGKPPQSRALRAAGFTAVASHDGYRGRTHTRTIELRGEELTLRDSIEGEGSAQLEVFFPIAPEWRVVPKSDGTIACLSGELEAVISIEGGESRVEPFAIARRFGIQESAARIVVTSFAALPHEITTRIRFGASVPRRELEPAHSSAIP